MGSHDLSEVESMCHLSNFTYDKLKQPIRPLNRIGVPAQHNSNNSNKNMQLLQASSRSRAESIEMGSLGHDASVLHIMAPGSYYDQSKEHDCLDSTDREQSEQFYN